MKVLRYILILGFILCGMFLSSCDVHEFPTPLQKFVLHLDYDTNLPLYKVVTFESNATRADNGDDFKLRYIVKAYPAKDEDKSSGRKELYQFVFTKDDISSPNNSVELELLPGKYNFVVWTDYINNASDDLHYDTYQFEAITLRGESHVGCTDYKDAFCGTITSTVSKAVQEARVDMRRPMAKFNFISNDVNEFLNMVSTVRAKNAAKELGEDADTSTNNDPNSNVPLDKDIDITDFDVIIRYNSAMPSVYNLYTNRPSDTSSGVSFKSKINVLENGEAELGLTMYLSMRQSLK